MVLVVSILHLCTSLVPLLAPTGMSKHKCNDSGLMDNNEHQVKRRQTNTPVAIAKGNVPLQKAWEMTELSKELLLKFWVCPLALS